MAGEEDTTRDQMKEEFLENGFTINGADLRLAKYVAAQQRYKVGRDFLRNKDMDKKVLARALKRLPNLTDIDIILFSCTIGAKELMNTFGSTCGAEYEFSGRHSIDTLMHSLQTIPIRSLKFSAATDHAFHHRPIIVEKDPSSEWRPQGNLTIQHNENVPCASVFAHSIRSLSERPSSLQSLDTLELIRLRPVEQRGDKPQEYYDSIYQLICNNAHKLRKLKLKEMSTDGLPSTDLTGRLAQRALPNLTDFSLSRALYRNEERFLAFFAANAATLERVHLERVSFEHGSIVNVAEGLRRIKFEKLKSFSLDFLLHHKILELAPFVMEQTQLNPLQENLG